jgi:cell division protein FtsW (lipid II flippase)
MAGDYSELKDDLDTLKKYVDERRTVIRTKADALKSQYYWSQMLVLFGGVLLVILGTIQATLTEESIIFTGANAIIGFALGLVVLFGRELKFQRRWLKATNASEQMKQERFRFLGRIGEYGSADPVKVLRRRLDEIEEELQNNN